MLSVGHYRASVATRIVEALAAQTSAATVEFPGDHTGYMWRPREFADTLRTVLD